MYYLVYKTTNKINGKFYIGKHQCESLDDYYLGSGVALLKAIKKYGRKNFFREILFTLASQSEMSAKEKELVTEELINNPSCYNLTIGGEGGPAFKGRAHSDKTKEVLRQKKLVVDAKRTAEEKCAIINKVVNTRKNKNYKHSEETKQKIRAKTIARYQKLGKLAKSKKTQSKEEANLSRSLKQMGHAVTQETRDKLSDSLRGNIPSNKYKVGINNSIINKYVSADELQIYLDNGWTKGRKPYKKYSGEV